MSIVAESYDDNSFCAVKVDISSTGSIKITIHIFDTTQTKTEADCQALHAIQSPRQQIATRSSTHQRRSQTTCFQQNAMSQRTSVFQAVSTTKGMHKCTASHHLISAHAATNSGNTKRVAVCSCPACTTHVLQQSSISSSSLDPGSETSDIGPDKSFVRFLYNS